MVKGQVDPAAMIIVIIFAVIIGVVGYTILSQFAEATPDQKALRDAKESIEAVCAPTGPNYRPGYAIVPEGYKIELKIGGILEVKKDNEVLAKNTLACPENTIFSNCVIGPSIAGHEGMTFGVNKTITINANVKIAKITLNGTGVTCTD